MDKKYKIEIKELLLKDLIPMPGNPQKMDKRTFDGLVKSMKRQGWLLDPPVVAFIKNKYQIISGHHRIKAAIEAKINKTKCKVIIGLTEKEIKILVLEANKRRGNLDNDLVIDFIEDIKKKFKVNLEEIFDTTGLDIKLDIINDEEKNIAELSAPFPYFGGKSKIADFVWQSLGQPKHYIEPFFGSGAVLFARPDYDPTIHVETINDADGYIANVWRAIQFNPDETAKWCDWPVNHADLSARKKRLIEKKEYLLQNLIEDEKWFDAELAGYWIWAASCWIGSGLTRPNAIPNIANAGAGIHKIGKKPSIGNTGSGVHKISQIPQISNAGEGVHAKHNTNIYDWFHKLSERLRYVRVVCGDWTRVCGGNWQNNMGNVGIFFDPPYAAERDNIYDVDSYDVAHAVRKWCIERGKIKTYKIVLAGYEEHEELKKNGWIKYNWKTGGGYGNQGNSLGKENRFKETLWCSPYCLKTNYKQKKIVV